MTARLLSSDAVESRLVEDAGLNASAPRQQRWIDGWLVRFAPGKAKRARCIQAVAAGRLSIEDKLARCLPVFIDAGLPMYLRVTPFSEPPGVDEALERLGWQAVDDTRVMVRRLEPRTADADDGAVVVEAVDADRFAAWVGRARGSSEAETLGHAERLRQSPVRHLFLLACDGGGRAVAAGQVAIEGAVAGVYDVVTLGAERGRGFGSGLCRALLGHACAEGATLAYLQVDAANDAARRIYRRLGFVDAYTYHYRTPRDDAR